MDSDSVEFVLPDLSGRIEISTAILAKYEKNRSVCVIKEPSIEIEWSTNFRALGKVLPLAPDGKTEDYPVYLVITETGKLQCIKYQTELISLRGCLAAYLNLPIVPPDNSKWGRF